MFPKSRIYGLGPDSLMSTNCLLPFDLSAVPLHHSCSPPGRLHRELGLALRLALPPLPRQQQHGLPLPHQPGSGQCLRIRAAAGGPWRGRRGDSHWLGYCHSFALGQPGERFQVRGGRILAAPSEAGLHAVCRLRKPVAQMSISYWDGEPHPANEPGSAQPGSAQTHFQV